MKIRSLLTRALLPAVLACQAAASIVVPEFLPAASSPDSFNVATPDKLADGSGLSAPVTSATPLADALAVTHLLDGGFAQSWVTSSAGGHYFASSPPPVLVFDLGEDRDLGRLLFWNYQNNGGGGPALRGNNTRTLEVRINTDAEGSSGFSGAATTVTLNATGADNPAQVVSFNGSGRYLQLTVTGNHAAVGGGGDRVGLGEFRAVTTGNPELATPGSIDVSSANSAGARPIGVPISNPGGSLDLGISAIRVTGPDAGAFTVLPSSSESLAPGAAGAIQLSFDPGGLSAVYEAVLEIDSNDEYFATVRVPISGTVRDPWISTVPSVVLPPVEGDDPYQFEVTVTNLGQGGDLVIDDSFLSGADAFSFTVVTGFPLTIGPGASAQVAVAFDPAGQSRVFAATLEFASNDTIQPFHGVAVTATGARASGLAAIIAPAFLPAASVADSYSTGTPVKLTDGSGLPALAKLPTGATLVEAVGVFHALNGGFAESWVTNAPGGFPSDYFAHAGQAPVLTFDLGDDVELGRLLFWQYQNTGGSGTAPSRGNSARTIEVRINTEAQGTAAFSGPASTITLANTDATNPAQAFRYLGTGRYLQLTVTDNFFGQPGITAGGDRVALGEFRAVLKGDPELLVPASVDISSANGTGARIIELPFENLGGSQSLNLADLRLTGGDAAFFTVVSPATPRIVAPGASGVIRLSFDPTGSGPGPYGTTLEIDSNDAHFATIRLPLAGVIRDPWIDTAAAVTLPPVAADAPVPVGFEVTVRNLGESGDLVIDAADFAGPDAPFFSVVTADFPLVIPRGQSVPLALSFDPAGESRPFQADLRVFSNDIVQTTRTIPVSAVRLSAGFHGWAASYGIPADESYDGGDHDGIPALIEYALGFDPTVAETLPQPQRGVDGVTVVWPKGEIAAADPALTYQVEVSADLADWDAPAGSDLTESAAGLALRLVDGGTGKAFARLRVTRQQP